MRNFSRLALTKNKIHANHLIELKNKKNEGGEKVKNILDFKPLNDFGAELISMSGYAKFSEIADFISANMAKIAGADRVCLITLREDNLVIEGGYPSNEHGVGLKLIPETGKDFIMRVIENQVRVLIPSPEKDSRTTYLNGIVEKYGIRSIMFVPLFVAEEPLGVLVLDFIKTNHKKNLEEKKEWHIILRFLAHHAAQAIYANKKRREKEKEIRRLQKLALIGEYADRVSHTIRNTLVAAGGLAVRLQKKMGKITCSEANCKEYVDMFVEDIQRAEKILREVLAFTQPAKLNCLPVNINQHLNMWVNSLIKSERFKTRLVIDFDKKLNHLKIFCDIGKVEQCLNDLILNAIHEQVGATRVRISTRLNASQKKVFISVVNNGKQIDQEMRNKIFEPFMTTKADGTGLGLANVKAIVDAHNGEIFVANKSYGTEFTISLPYSNNHFR